MRRVLQLLTLLFATTLSAQPRPPLSRALADALYCKLGVGCPGFAGTVTSVGNGTIGSLFTATWATATTTPALSLDITNQGTVVQVLHGNAAGHPSFGSVVSADLNVTGTTCSSQFLTVLSTSLAGTCTTATLAGAQFANQGTTTTLLHGAAAGNPSWASVVSADMNITTSTCTNQFVSAISSGGVGTCTTDTLASAQHANQGTTTTLLHGAAAGNPSFGAVISADLNITATTCTNQFLSALSSAAAGTCTGLTLAAFPTIPTNTVLLNATSGTAVPTAQTVSTCSAAGSALNWTTNTGFGCNSSITANTATTATNTTNTAVTDDTTTNATMFPTWVTTASGNQPQKVSSTLLTFNPSTANFGIGGSPSATSGIRLLVQMNGNQVTKISSSNPDSTDTGAAANVNAAADVSVAQLSAFGSTYSGTLAGLNLAGSASVNNGGGGTVGFTVGSTSAAPVVLMTNATRALTISASSQAVSLRGTQTNDNAIAGDVGEFTNAQCPGPTTTATITVTIASPGVVTWTGHPFSGTAPRFDACPVVFTTGGALPTGITATTTYWVVPTTISGNNFSIATSVANAIAGTSINTTGSQSGTHTGTAGSALTTATAKDVTGLALTAGHWDCSALLARGLGGTTSVTLLKSSISTTSATDGTIPAGTMNQYAQAASVPANDVDESIGPLRLLNSGTTNTFLVADDTFTLSTNKAYGTIRCSRVR